MAQSSCSPTHRLYGASLLAAAVVLCSAAEASAEDAHPAVVRVIAPERNATSYGSGALVAVSETHGIVVTNWHVVRDAAGPIMIVFPDGFRSGATVMKADQDWDLAALAIWRPDVRPIALATDPPRPGEVLTIAGYGRGWYRAAAGRCTKYVSPGRNLPFEMVELGATARQGDSGGPILNSRGELAGVLFGAGLGYTAGTYCGRVRWFLDEPLALLQRLPGQPTMIARRRQPQPRYESAPYGETVRLPAAIAARPAAPVPNEAVDSSDRTESRKGGDEARGGWDMAKGGSEKGQRRPGESASQPHLGASPRFAPGARPHVSSPWAPVSRFEQIEMILAAIGAFALLYHGLCLAGRATR